MPRNGSGTYSLPSGNPVVTGTTISSTTHNNTMNDIATAMTGSLAANGETTPSANLPMGGYKHTGVGDASAVDQYPSTKQVQNQSFTWCGTAGGSANALTLTPSPAISAYATGQSFTFKASASNSTAATVAVSGLTTIALQNNGAALVGGEIVSGLWYRITLDTASTAQVEALGGVSAFMMTVLDDPDAATARATLGATIPVGTIMDYVGTSAPTGWVLASGLTIGDASSSATGRANADTSDLFTLLWNSMSNTEAPVSTGRGASAAADFAAHKTITLPDFRGRVAVGKDNMGGSTASRITAAGSGITGTTLGTAGGTETHTLTAAQMPSHTHTANSNGTTQAAYTGSADRTPANTGTNTTSSAGSDQAHNNTQPSYVVNKIIKL